MQPQPNPPLLQAMRSLQTVLDEYDVCASERAELGRSDWRCLRFLVENGDARPGVIQQALGLTSGSVTALLDRLSRRKLIQRTSDSQDRRALVVSATEAAHRLVTLELAPLADVAGRLSDRMGVDRNTLQIKQLTDCARLVEWATNKKA